MGTRRKKIAIIGGGITGLSAAFYTKRLLEEQKASADLYIIEKSPRLGGKIKTLKRDGFVIEQGPESFLARKQPVMTLTKELGLEGELIGTNPNEKGNYILHKGKLHPMPLGFVLGIPTKLTPFMKTGLISPFGKIRAGLDLLLPRKNDASDEALGQFIKRRLGSEVLHNITEPLLSGIYAGNTDYLSLQATFPQFKQLEDKHGSLIKGMLKGQSMPRQTIELPDAAKKSMFLTFKGGLSTLIEGLQKAIETENILLGKGVKNIKKIESGYRLLLENEEELQVDGVIMASQATHVSELLPNFSMNHLLNQIEYVSVANISLTFNKRDIQFPLKGYGFVIPRNEGKNITACTWSSSKWTHTAPEEKVLLRAYVGHAGNQQWTSLSDEELVSMVRNDLKNIMGITAQPNFSEVSRCYKAMPQYIVGHVERLKKIRERLQQDHPGIFICGAGYEGVGIPDCIKQGKEAAENLIEFLPKK